MTILDYDQVYNILRAQTNSMANIMLWDDKYNLFSRSFVENQFSEALRDWQIDFGNKTWRPQVNDCDKFSRWAQIVAIAINDRSDNNGAAASFGVVAYYSEQLKGYHATNIFLLKEDDLVKVCFYEPQTREIIELSKNELQSINQISL